MFAHMSREAAFELGILLLIVLVGLLISHLAVAYLGARLAKGRRRVLASIAGFFAGILAFVIPGFVLSGDQTAVVLCASPLAGLGTAFTIGYIVAKMRNPPASSEPSEEL